MRLLPLLLLVACGFIDAGENPIIEAHRGAPGYWPENSRTAMLNSIAAGYDGLEFDLVLTKDLVPVIHHDPWISQRLCTTADGEPIPEAIRIKDLTLEELLEGYLCGGVPDEYHPDAEVIAEPLMTWDELIEALHDADPDMVVHIDLKYEPGLTHDPETFAEAVLPPWFEANLPNPHYVSNGFPELLLAIKERAADEGLDMRTSLTWPTFTHDTNNTVTAMKGEFATLLGTDDLVAVARRGHADGLNIPWQVADRRRIEMARSRGVEIQIWTINDEALLQRFQRWPVDALITDYPEYAR